MRASTNPRSGRGRPIRTRAPGQSPDAEGKDAGGPTKALTKASPSAATTAPLAASMSSSASATTPDGPAAPLRKDRGRDPLLAAICHDLRAPLAAVTMGANFVLQTTPDEEEGGRSRRVLQAILRSCKQMERLVRDFGDLSEIEADAVELRLGIHDAAEMLTMAAEAAKPGGLARSVSLEVLASQGEPLLLRCDRDRMLRAIGHVVDNAVRFSPDGGIVSLAVDEVDDEVRFTVVDRGAGFSEETLANLYDRTWHAKRADRVGAGLGLAIVRGVLAAHGGRVDVATAPNTPTTFTLALPKDRASDPGAPR